VTYLPAYFFCDFLRFLGSILEKKTVVFLSSSCRETAKNANKKIEGKAFLKKGREVQVRRFFVFSLSAPWHWAARVAKPGGGGG
jgi:hypothetical protein